MSDSLKSLLPEERRRLILAHLEHNGASRVVDLAALLGVTPITIRRDLRLLADEGSIRRVHGGVTRKNDGAPRIENPAQTTNLDGQDESVVVGMVVPSLEYYWPSVARGAKERATSRGLNVVLRESAYQSPGSDEAQVRHLVEQVGAQGLLLTVTLQDPSTQATLEWVRERGIPVVLVERHVDPLSDAPFESVTSDHRAGAVLAVKTLVEMGHTRIGMICPADSPTSPHLQVGWDEACLSRGLEPEHTLNETIDNATPHVLTEELNRILDLLIERDITAVMVHADPEANMMVQVAQNRGLSVPGDLSIIAYDDAIASLLTPALTAIRPPRHTIGGAAVDLMAERLAEPGRPVHRVTLSPRLTIRDSTAPPRP